MTGRCWEAIKWHLKMCSKMYGMVVNIWSHQSSEIGAVAKNEGFIGSGSESLIN